ncbi:MAG: TonB-dependent receptor [Spongiibacteraceae bacterium]
MKRSSLFISITAILLGGHIAPSIAQERKATLEEVIVTSRRVEESVQSVPLAVSALTGEMLESRGVARMNDLVTSTPAVTSQPTSGRSSVVNFGIRGQRNTDVLPTADPSVIVYIADIPQMRGYGLGALGALDVQTVEVLKGPQGTLFGRSTTGGAIVITPNAPTNEATASVTLGVGERNRQMGRAIFNLPVTDTIAARVALQTEKADGYLHNKGSVGRDAYGDRDEQVWRASLQFLPSDELTSTFYSDGFQSNENGAMVDPSFVRPGGPAAAFFGLAPDGDKYAGTTNLSDAHSKLTVYGISNTTSYDISDSLTIKNIAGARYIDVDDRWDLDGSNRPVLSVLNLATTHQYSEELQLSGSMDEKLDWITGVFWFKEYSDDDSYTNAFAPATSTPSLTGTYGRNISQSVFGQGTYHFTDNLNLTVGARYNHDERLITASSFSATGACSIQLAVGVTAPANNCERTESKTFTEPSYNVTLDYHLDVDKMIYAAHRHGYRSGGFNGRAAAVTPQLDTFAPFDPETVNDFEVGFKGDLDAAGSPLRINASLFYSDYQEIQRVVATVNPTTNQLATSVVNAASATLYGGELEVTWLPLDSLQIDVFASYIHAEYDEWLDPGNPDPAQRDKSDSDFATPEYSGGVTAKYTLPVPAEIGEMSVQGNVYAQAETQLADENGPGGLQSGYSLVGGRVDWQNVMGSNVKLGLWGKNLNNTKYYAGGINTNGTVGYYIAYPGTARAWGLDATYDF